MREDSYRLANGTPPIAAFYAIQPGVDILNQIGVDAIRVNSLRQTDLLIRLADEAGYVVNSPRNSDERAGTVTLNPPNAYAVSRELLARNIVIDYREGAGIRVAPHFYNTDDEIVAVMRGIKAILEDGSWQKHVQGKAFVT